MLALHRFLLGLYGVSFLGTGAIMFALIAATMIEGAKLDWIIGLKTGMATLTLLSGISLMQGSRLPTWIYAPQRVIHSIGTFLLLAAISGTLVGLSFVGYGMIATDKTHQILLAPVFPAALTVGIAALLGILVSVAAALGANTASAEDPETVAQVVQAPPRNHGALARLLAGVMTLATTLVSGLALVTMLYAHEFLPEVPALPLIEEGQRHQMFAIIAMIMSGLGVVPMRALHGHTLYPRHFSDVARKMILLSVFVGPALWHAERIIGDLLPAPWNQIHALRLEIVGGGALAIFVLALLISALNPAGKRQVAGMEQFAAVPAQAAGPDRRGSKIQQSHGVVTIKQVDVPDIGWLMKTYRVTDWLLLRLFGAMLLFMAYMIHQVEDYELYKVGGILYGIAPQTVMYVYAAWGAMLLLPAILPGFISRPQTVFGGAAKAAILVGLSILIMPGLDAAIDLYAGSEYRGALHSSVPGIFKGVAGLAVFSAMAIALFRNLSGTPVVLDGMGRPTQRFSAEDLRALRAARMQG